MFFLLKPMEILLFYQNKKYKHSSFFICTFFLNQQRNYEIYIFFFFLLFLLLKLKNSLYSWNWCGVVEDMLAIGILYYSREQCLFHGKKGKRGLHKRSLIFTATIQCATHRLFSEIVF